MSTVITTAPVQVKSTSKKAQTTEISIVDKIRRLQQRDELVGNSITFRYPNGGTLVQSINKAFVTSENGRDLHVNTIIENINSIQWDLGADSFDID